MKVEEVKIVGEIYPSAIVSRPPPPLLVTKTIPLQLYLRPPPPLLSNFVTFLNCKEEKGSTTILLAEVGGALSSTSHIFSFNM